MESAAAEELLVSERTPGEQLAHSLRLQPGFGMCGIGAAVAQARAKFGQLFLQSAIAVANIRMPSI